MVSPAHVLVLYTSKKELVFVSDVPLVGIEIISALAALATFNTYQTSFVVVPLWLMGLPVAVASARFPPVPPQEAITFIAVAFEQRSLAGCAKLLIVKNKNVQRSSVSCFMAYMELLDVSKIYKEIFSSYSTIITFFAEYTVRLSALKRTKVHKLRCTKLRVTAYRFF